MPNLIWDARHDFLFNGIAKLPYDVISQIGVALLFAEPSGLWDHGLQFDILNDSGSTYTAVLIIEGSAQMATSGHSPFILTPLDNVMPRNYVPRILFFPKSPGTDVFIMVDKLRDGLSKTLDAMKPLSGTIQAYGQQGGLCVNAPWNSVDDIFHVKDLTHEEGLEYQKLKDNEFSIKDRDIRLLMPMEIFTKIEKTVMFVELNIIKGGLVMVLCLHHSFTDGIGTVAITNVWAAYCRGDDSS